MKSQTLVLPCVLAVVAIAVGFWLLALGPKRQEADHLSAQVKELQSSLTESQAKVTKAIVARHQFPTNYQQIVLLGKAAPTSDGTSSLLVELSHIAHHSHVRFNSIQLAASAGTSSPAPAPASTTTTPTTGGTAAPAGTGTSSSGQTTAATVPATEAAASLLPLGATIGPASLAVTPYELSFSGNFFHVADFIRGVDSLVHTGGHGVDVNGRLITLNGFAITAPENQAQPNKLEATFSVTTYLIPPSQGLTAGATPTAPSTATPTAATTSASESSTTSAASVSNSK